MDRASANAMDWAAINGILEVLRWLKENRKEGCTGYALTAAAMNGHLDIVKILLENQQKRISFDLIYIEEALDLAIKYGYSSLQHYIEDLILNLEI